MRVNPLLDYGADCSGMDEYLDALAASIDRGQPLPPYDRAPAAIPSATGDTTGTGAGTGAGAGGQSHVRVPITLPVRLHTATTHAPLDPTTTTLLSPHTGEDLWHPGGPTEYGIEVFTAGDCWALAWYLAHNTGGRLVTVGWPDWRHVAVRLDHHDRNLYLDATGLRTRAELASAWGGKVVPLNMNLVETFDDYEEVLDAGFVYDITHGEVSDFAHLLTALYLPTLATGTAVEPVTGDLSVSFDTLGTPARAMNAAENAAEDAA